MEFENVLWAVEGAVGVLTVNRARVLNSLDAATLRELAQAIGRIRDHAEVRAVVVAGAGERAFVAGADIAAMAEMSAVEGREFSRLGHEVMDGLEGLDQPVVAAVSGYCLGGGLELALACDFVVASDTAAFGQPEINLGVIPGFGGTQRLARRVGVGRAREIIYLGERLDAARALALGLIDRIVPAARVREEACALAQALAGKPRIALALAKRTVNGGFDLDLRSGCRLEIEGFASTFASEDRREGMRAFLERRAPVWRGR